MSPHKVQHDAPLQRDWWCHVCGSHYVNPLPCYGVRCPSHVKVVEMRPTPPKTPKTEVT